MIHWLQLSDWFRLWLCSHLKLKESFIIINHLFWSNLVRQVKFSFGMEGQLLCKIQQFVLAGLAMTTILQSFLATLLRALPYSTNILLFLEISSALSIDKLVFSHFIGIYNYAPIPFSLGNPPIKTATSISLKSSSGSDPTLTSLTIG